MNQNEKIENNIIEITADEFGIKMIKGFTTKKRMKEQLENLREVLLYGD